MKSKSISNFNKYPLKYIVAILLLYAIGIFILLITNVLPSRLVQLMAVLPMVVLLMIREFETKLLALFFVLLGIHHFWDENFILTHFVLFLPFFLFFWIYRHPLIKFERNGLTIPFFILALSFITSMLFSKHYQSSMYMLINYTQAIFFGIYMISYVSTPEDFRRIVKLLSLSLIIPLSMGVYQIFYMFDPALNHVKGTFMSRNSFAPFLAFHFFLFLGFFIYSKKTINKIILIIIEVIILWVFLNTFSRGAYIGLLLAIALYLFLMLPKRYKLMFPVVILVLVLLMGGLLYSFGDAKYLARFDMETLDMGTIVRIGLWESAINMFSEKPIIGFGPNTFQDEYLNYFPVITGTSTLVLEINHTQAHNIVLNTMAEQGLIGLVALLFSIVLFFRYLFKMYKDSLCRNDKMILSLFLCYFVYFIVHNMVDIPMTAYHHINSQFILASYFALIVSYDKLRYKLYEKN